MEMTKFTLNDDHKLFLIDLFAKGYTARTVAKRFKEQFALDIHPTQILQQAVLYADDVEVYRAELGQMSLQAGLARKEERVRRLSELAEAWEETALEGGSTKAGQLYLKALSQIRDEVDPLGLRIPLDPEDPWHQLLQRLQLPAQQLPDQTQQT